MQLPRVLLITADDGIKPFFRTMLRFEQMEAEILHFSGEHSLAVSADVFQGVDVILLDSLGSQFLAVSQQLSNHPSTHAIPFLACMTTAEQQSLPPLFPPVPLVTKPFDLEQGEPVRSIRQLLPAQKRQVEQPPKGPIGFDRLVN